MSAIDGFSSVQIYTVHPVYKYEGKTLLVIAIKSVLAKVSHARKDCKTWPKFHKSLVCFSYAGLKKSASSTDRNVTFSKRSLILLFIYSRPMAQLGPIITKLIASRK